MSVLELDVKSSLSILFFRLSVSSILLNWLRSVLLHTYIISVVSLLKFVLFLVLTSISNQVTGTYPQMKKVVWVPFGIQTVQHASSFYWNDGRMISDNLYRLRTWRKMKCSSFCNALNRLVFCNIILLYYSPR